MYYFDVYEHDCAVNIFEWMQWWDCLINLLLQRISLIWLYDPLNGVMDCMVNLSGGPNISLVWFCGMWSDGQWGLSWFYDQRRAKISENCSRIRCCQSAYMVIFAGQKRRPYKQELLYQLNCWNLIFTKYRLQELLVHFVRNEVKGISFTYLIVSKVPFFDTRIA